jgi:hypothetical protein
VGKSVLLFVCLFLHSTARAQSPVENWRQVNFGTMNNSGTAADSADPDHDGLPNLVEYATGLNPLVTSHNPMSVSISGGLIHVTVSHNTGAADAVLEVQSTTTLFNPQSWTTNGMVVDQNTSQLSVHHLTPVAGSPARFLRLKATNLNFTVPSAPSNLILTAPAGPAGAQINVSWNAPLNNGGMAIDSYYVAVYANSVLVASTTAFTTSASFTGMTTASYPAGTVGKSYQVEVTAHSSVGYGIGVAGSITPKISYFADNLRGIFSKAYASGSCINCHGAGLAPNLTPTGTTDYSSAVAEGTLIYQLPAGQIANHHVGISTFGPASFEYKVLQQWVADGHLQ